MHATCNREKPGQYRHSAPYFAVIVYRYYSSLVARKRGFKFLSRLHILCRCSSVEERHPRSVDVASSILGHRLQFIMGYKGIPSEIVRENVMFFIECWKPCKEIIDLQHVHKFELENRNFGKYKQEVCKECGILGKRIDT